MKFLRQLGVVFSFVLVSTAAMAFLVPSQAAAQTPDKEFTIAVGETLTFSGQGVRSVSIGLPQVADAQVSSDRELIVSGKEPGTTTISIQGSEGRKTLLVRVVPVNPESLAEEVKEVLGPDSGVDVRVVKGRVLLEGEVAGEEFKDKLDTLTELYPEQVLNFTTYREAFVEGARMVALDIYFVQLATTDRDQLGVEWGQFIGANYTFGSGETPLYYGEDALSGGGGGGESQLDPGVMPGETGTLLSKPAEMTGGEGLNSYWSLVGQVNVALDFLVENGLVKTINHGTVITEAGEEASYHNGGTLLVEVSGLSTQGVEEIPYGLEVDVKPVLDVDNNVKLELEMDYSDLDQANGVGELPALRNNKVKSMVNTQAGQSVLVSSQQNVNSTSNEGGWWLLSDIPILGWIFKSRNLVDRTLDNALFVTPRVYEPGGKSHNEMINGVFKQLLDAGIDGDELPEVKEAKDSKGDDEDSDGDSDAEPSLVD
ncbi:MAG: type II and III secretion system protein family protein [Persicimonas sp.]